MKGVVLGGMIGTEEMVREWDRLRVEEPAVYREKIDQLHRLFGTHKRVVDTDTGLAYRVPVEHIATKGLAHGDLSTFPTWED